MKHVRRNHTAIVYPCVALGHDKARHMHVCVFLTAEGWHTTCVRVSQLGKSKAATAFKNESRKTQQYIVRGTSELENDPRVLPHGRELALTKERLTEIKYGKLSRTVLRVFTPAVRGRELARKGDSNSREKTGSEKTGHW